MAARSASPGDKNIAWIEAYCRVPEGKLIGQPIRLRPWQRRIIKSIYDTPTRRAIVSFGRKSGKTALAACLLLLHLCGLEAKRNSQLYSGAQSRDQAAILFALAAKMVRQSPDLVALVTIRETIKHLHCAELGTLYRALSADASTAYGLSPAFVVHDELGQVRGPRSELYEALETAQAAQDDPLSIIISTQAPTDADLLSVLIDDAKAGSDPRTKLFLFTADPLLDPFSDRAIKQANPAYGDFQNATEVRAQAEDARRMPSRESAYRNLILNQRTSQSTPFVARRVWEACAGAVDDAAFAVGRVYMALDLSARNDLTALAAIVRDLDGVWHAKLEFFAPAVGITDRAHRDRAPYDLWRDQGHITATPGASVEYAVVAARLMWWLEQHDVAVVGYDRWRMDVLKSELQRLGAPQHVLDQFREHGQGYRDMAPSLDAIEAELLNENVRHGGNPVLTWCAANAIATMDPAGNRKLDKAKSTGRIDGLVALAMAFGVAAGAEQPMVISADYEMLVV